ncbi:adenosine 3'-phospho 5'-phosphosulfate transporter 1-like isoform X2 [Asterias rubens]|uniref:adenosine 3'-phospho 5'-phosphosulfate transporter 1-like isoform X2 n=1 Tax=Asterias rubens TaxID=7604 RepID=UPI0014555B04|nr:adenosine 3'-phospho 5'-phosphosulfate transporter 1-like isoform X2 [Asterias rubens]
MPGGKLTRLQSSSASFVKKSTMAAHTKSIIVLLVIVTTSYQSHFTQAADPAADIVPKVPTESWTDFWIVRLGLNILGYGSVCLPAWLLIRYIKRSGYLERGGHGCMFKSIRMCVAGDEEKSSVEDGGIKTTSPEAPKGNKAMMLIFCVIGLQGSYLTWGVLQERIMKHEYGKDETNPGEKFNNSQFLVFMNRILAFTAAGVVVLLTNQPRHSAPMYKYSYSSLSNIMSSWCQYEALKFVSFPTQVLAKASKIIPVMLMGKVVSGKTYEYYEYVTAGMISIGVAMFLLSQKEGSGSTTVTTFSGVIILIGYMVFDSFTSNWQAELYKQYSVSSMQMMFGVNLFSCILTSWSLIGQGGFAIGLDFMFKYSTFMYHVLLLSVCSATGQLFIFYTISQFGAVVFVIIMTTRSGLAIFLSCLVYGHPISIAGVFGVLVVFSALFLRVYAQQRKKAQKAREARLASELSSGNKV